MNSGSLRSVQRLLHAGFFFLLANSGFSQQTIPVDETATSVLVKQARGLLEDGKTVEAIPFLKEMLVRFSTMTDPGAVKARQMAMYQLGTCYLDAQRYVDAAELFQQFVVDYPNHESVQEARFLTLEALAWLDDPAPMQAYIDEMKRRGEFDKLLSILGTKTDATRHAVLSLLTAYAKKADFSNFSRFLPFCDEDARSDIGLNLALRLTALFAGISDDSEEYAEALLAAENLEMFTTFPLWQFAEAAVARGELDRVQQALDLFHEKYAESEGAFAMSNVQIRLLMKTGRMEEALALAEQNMENDSDDSAVAQTYMLAAEALRSMGQYDRAMSVYGDFLSVRSWRGPLTPQAVYWSGVCARELGRMNEACAWFQRVYVLYGQHLVPESTG